MSAMAFAHGKAGCRFLRYVEDVGVPFGRNEHQIIRTLFDDIDKLSIEAHKCLAVVELCFAKVFDRGLAHRRRIGDDGSSPAGHSWRRTAGDAGVVLLVLAANVNGTLRRS